VALNALVAISFFVTAASGIYFLFAPSGGQGVGHNVTWDLIHTWAGVVLIVAAVAHLAIHWRWVKNVTQRLALSLWPQPRRGEALAEG
jgi:membrane protease YdiL (CAAX protease family)